jgi:DNA polymerase-3 subunit alpha
MIKMAMELEGMPRHAGTHAAGVVISKDSWIPIFLFKRPPMVL